jgi:hypothetical protein
VDQAFVMLLKVEGPSLAGTLKAVDPDKGTITIAIPNGRREDPEEKTFTLAKDARVTLDGSETPLGNLKAGENGPAIELRFSLDLLMVQSVTARTFQPRQ